MIANISYLSNKCTFMYIFGLESRCPSTQGNVLAQLEIFSLCFVMDFLWPGFNS